MHKITIASTPHTPPTYTATTGIAFIKCYPEEINESHTEDEQVYNTSYHSNKKKHSLKQEK